MNKSAARTACIFATLVLANTLAIAQNIPALFDRPGGLVPNQRTAIAIAEAVLFPIYGEKVIHDQRPYVVKHIDGKWIIDGTLPRGLVGGTFHIVIRQRDARVIEISHGA
jgi:hypothetical protein